MLLHFVKLTLAQMPHPTFRKVFFAGMALTLVCLALCLFGLRLMWPDGALTGWAWLDEWLLGWTAFTFVAVFAVYFLFPPVAMVFMGLMLDKIILAVEARHYPNKSPVRTVSLGENTIMAIKQGAVVLCVNTVFLIFYIPLFFLSFGTLAALLYLLVNGYLIGREYFDMVSIRFMSRRDARHLYIEHTNKAFSGGAIVAGMFLIPGINIITPVFGAALMTHMVHTAMQEEEMGR